MLFFEAEHERMFSFDSGGMGANEIRRMIVLHAHEAVVANVTDSDRRRRKTKVVDVIEARDAAIGEDRAMELFVSPGVAQRKGEDHVGHQIEQCDLPRAM